MQKRSERGKAGIRYAWAELGRSWRSDAVGAGRKRYEVPRVVRVLSGCDESLHDCYTGKGRGGVLHLPARVWGVTQKRRRLCWLILRA